MTKYWFCSLLLILFLVASLRGQSRESVLKSVAETSPFAAVDQATTYDDNTIKDLAGRRTSSLIKYGFIGATRQNWKGPEGNVRLTLYEMVDASAAYGLFTLERKVDQPGFTALPLGSEAFRVGNRSHVWQSKYVAVLEGNRAASDSLARVVVENIFGRSRKPPVSSLLPPSDLLQGSDKYLVDESSFEGIDDLDPKTLGFEDSVEVATAKYRVNGKSAQLILMLYPTQQMARKYAEQWEEANTSIGTPFRKRVGAILALVRGTMDTEVAKAILDGVHYETQVTWNEPKPGLVLREIILTIFTFIGIALVFTVMVGLSFGGIRVFVKARYPGRVFDRSEEMEIIQLKLGQGVSHRELKP